MNFLRGNPTIIFVMCRKSECGKTKNKISKSKRSKCPTHLDFKVTFIDVYSFLANLASSKLKLILLPNYAHIYTER